MADGSGKAAPAAAQPEKIELRGLFATMLGVWYPKDYLVSAIDPGKGPAAVEGLRAAGFGDNAIHLHDSATVCRNVEAIDKQKTVLERAKSSIAQALTDEGMMSQEYFDEAKAGASLLAVMAPDPRLMEQARRILASHGARRMRYYDDRTITDL